VGCTTKENNKSNYNTNEQIIATAQDSIDILNIYNLNIADKGDLNALKKTWSEDARWLNAFGRVFIGRDTIISFLNYLYKQPGYAVSNISRQENPDIKFLRPDVVVIHEYHEREGQLINNQVTPTRKINSTYILTKENGIWLIRDKVTMDERERTN
jgi:hypothetical protein